MKDQSNFIKTIMENDLESGKHNLIITRFPPEPNGYLHIGHARAIIINFELAKHFGGYTNLRFDDTNPEKEELKFVKSIEEDVRWLGYNPKAVYFASDYFQEMFDRAVLLIKKGLAYVCDLTAEEISEYRGNVTTPGKNSPYRNRSVAENLKLFYEMKDGKYQEGERVLRAKIDMASPNMNMRDPVIYRINYEEHHNTGNKWVIYPMYDYAHPLEDAIEGITHSLCSLEFEDHRPLYDWCVEHTEMPKVPRQIEFGRLNIDRTAMSKRYLRMFVEQGLVSGWDDPRMPTIQGLRRRGYTPNAIRNFILASGLSKTNGSASIDMVEHFVREDLQKTTNRLMAVKKPLKVTITNYPEGQLEKLDVILNDELSDESRTMYFGRHIYIEQDDFVVEKPNRQYKRLYLGGEVRLMNAYFIQANDVVYDDEGNIIEVLATYDIETKSGTNFTGRKPNGNIHFVEATTAVKAEFRRFEPLLDENEESSDYLERFNHESIFIDHGYVENYLKDVKPEEKFQFIRQGFYSVDYDSTPEEIVFNQVVALKSSYRP
ncbi:MAG TPA: glutamine--tRNA ligase/YqeY domain fusion protein [Acholeplasmataceae bacterium]|nr:glutamine--tRNA ligase/YqeY domain fusion protein [Acholeplasmataceae bacterium]HQC30432.1 glutamine--tRNA ligase/YqeY domain fusion protein [Acholeplasmataceae bacterium]